MQRLIDEQLDRSESITSAVVVGVPWYEICRYARDHQIDLIVIATHGATGMKHLLMGSMAERVVQHASAPVLAVKSIERDFLEEYKRRSSIIDASEHLVTVDEDKPAAAAMSPFEFNVGFRGTTPICAWIKCQHVTPLSEARVNGR